MLDPKPTVLFAGGRPFDWRVETTFIYHATLSHTATSDFKPSHPPSSSPEPTPHSTFLSYKSSSSHRPVGAEQGDTPFSNHQQVGNSESKKGGREQKIEERTLKTRRKEWEIECEWTPLSTWEGDLMQSLLVFDRHSSHLSGTKGVSHHIRLETHTHWNHTYTITSVCICVRTAVIFLSARFLVFIVGLFIKGIFCFEGIFPTDLKF